MGQSASTRRPCEALGSCGQDEQAALTALFNVHAKGRPELTAADFEDMVGLVPKSLRGALFATFAAYSSHSHAGGEGGIDVQAFAGSAAEMVGRLSSTQQAFAFEWALRSAGAHTTAQATAVHHADAAPNRDETLAHLQPATVPRAALAQFVRDVATAAMATLLALDGIPFNGSISDEFARGVFESPFIVEASKQPYQAGASDLAPLELPEQFDRAKFTRWWTGNRYMPKLLAIIATHTFFRASTLNDAFKSGKRVAVADLAKDREVGLRLPLLDSESGMLRPEDVWFLSVDMQPPWRLKWRLLFTDTQHGMSWATLCAQILRQGPTFLLIEDEAGHVFGGFASASWARQPNFFGDDRSFLFGLKPSQAAYLPTRLNTNYQYLNSGKKTLPNGLGFGGQLDYFGLHISENITQGSCKARPICTTFASPRFSASEDFTPKRIEAWAVHIPPKDDEHRIESSALDRFREDRMILEWGGREQHSKNIRDDPPLEELEAQGQPAARETAE